MKALLDRAIEAVARARAPKEPPIPAGPQVEGHPNLERPRCPICSNTRAKMILRAKDTWVASGAQTFSVVRCEVCAHRYTTPRFKLEHRALAFEGAYPFYQRARAAREVASANAQDDRARRAFEGRAMRLSAVCPRPGRLLDLGCGDGYFLDVMRGRGWDVVGVDMEPDVVWHAKERLKLDARVLDLEEAALPEGPFEAITMWGVLQLIYRPRFLVERVRERLSPGGVLGIGVSNIRSVSAEVFGPKWYGLGLPRHLSHFTPDTLSRLLCFSGYGVAHVEYETPRWILAGSVDAALSGPRTIRRAAKAVSYAAGQLSGRTRMADTMEVYGRKLR